MELESQIYTKNINGGGPQYPPIIQKETNPYFLPPSGSFINLTPSKLLLSTLKKAEDRNSIIVRFWNPFEVTETATISTLFEYKSVYQCGLNEQRIEKIPSNKLTVSIEVGPLKIFTLEFATE
jgi:alpha-mannosidase